MVGTLVVVFVLFTLFYASPWGVVHEDETPIKQLGQHVSSMVLYSLGAMTTMGQRR